MSASEWNLILSEEYMKEMKAFFKNSTEKTELEYETYLSILDRICNETIKSGKTAEALRAFVDQARQLTGYIVEFGAEAAALIDDFVEKVDAADGKLY